MAKSYSWDAYWLALGRFIHTFTETEQLLFVLLYKTVRINHETATAVFSNTRVSEAISLIRRTVLANNIKLPKSLERAFEQLLLIASCRNDLVHHGAALTEHGVLAVATTFRSMPERDRIIPLSPEILENMIEDLRVIQWNLILPTMDAASKKHNSPSLAPSREDARYALTTWKYKARTLPRGDRGSKSRAI